MNDGESDVDRLLSESIVEPAGDVGETDFDLDAYVAERQRESTQGEERGAGDTAGEPSSGKRAEFWRSSIFTAADFANRPAKEWLVDGVLGVNDLAMLFGESGSAKTFVALDMLFTLIAGRTFAKRFDVPRPASAVYFTNEGHAGLGARLRAAMQFYSPSPDELNRLRVVTRVPQLFQRDTDASVAGLLDVWPDLAESGVVPSTPDVVVVDTLFGAAVGADENSAKDFTRIFESLSALRRELGCCVLLVHHTAKNGEKYRGSSAILGELDTQIKAAKAGRGRFTLSCEKLKDGEPWPVQGFDLVSVGLDSVRVDWTGDAVNRAGDRVTNADRVVEFLGEHAGESFTAADIADALGLHGGTAKNVYRWLRDLKLAGTVREEKLPDAGKNEPSRWTLVAE